MNITLPTKYDDLHWSEKKLVREEYIRMQSGKCWYCGQPLDGPPNELVDTAWIDKTLFPENFFEFPVHLHHNHHTGFTLGAVHNKCNAFMWQYHGQ